MTGHSRYYHHLNALVLLNVRMVGKPYLTEGAGVTENVMFKEISSSGDNTRVLLKRIVPPKYFR